MIHTDGDVGRMPPHDLQAEKAVIGSVILDRGVLDTIGLQPADFYADAHRKLFGHLQQMPSDQPVDAVTLTSWVRAAGDLDAIGGVAYIGEVCGAVPHPMVGITSKATSVNQKQPKDKKAVVPNVLFFFHSMIPAITWANPP